MDLQAILTLAILIVTLAVLASQRLRSDLVALLVMLSLLLTGILAPAEAFGAFGQPVIIIVPSIYVLGAALYDTGVARLAADRMSRVGNRGLPVLLLVVMFTAALLSAVLSSMLVVAVLMPAVLRLSRQMRKAPSQFLLPLVSGATMGNLLTVMGTVSNLVVSDLLGVGGHEPLRFFSLTPYGLVSLALASLWFLLVGHKLLRREMPSEPQRPSLDEVEQDYQLAKQLYRLRVRSQSDLIAQRLDQSPLGTTHRLNVLAIQPPGKPTQHAQADWVLDHNDVLIVEGSRGDILQAASRCHLEPKGAIPLEEFGFLDGESLRLAELMIPYRSKWVGKTLADVRFRERYDLNILAVQRRGQPIRENLPHLTLAPGDALLVQGALPALSRVGTDLNMVLVTHLGPQPGDTITGKAGLALGILGVMLVCVVSGLLPLATASLTAALALIVTGCVSLERAYESIDARIIVLIGGMLPLAMALEKSGAAALIAGQLADLGSGFGLVGTLLPLYLLASLISQITSNSVAAALMTPIAVGLATTQGFPPQRFALAVAVAVTTSYLTPLTNADNLLVREAGRYAMRDYLLHGLPVFLMQTTAVMLMLMFL
jgi:di/tricarboxylate transporter